MKLTLRNALFQNSASIDSPAEYFIAQCISFGDNHYGNDLLFTLDAQNQRKEVMSSRI